MNKEALRARQIKRACGIRLHDYYEIYDKQQGKCAICGTHQKDSTAILENAINYLNYHAAMSWMQDKTLEQGTQGKKEDAIRELAEERKAKNSC